MLVWYNRKKGELFICHSYHLQRDRSKLLLIWQVKCLSLSQPEKVAQPTNFSENLIHFSFISNWNIELNIFNLHLTLIFTKIIGKSAKREFIFQHLNISWYFEMHSIKNLWIAISTRSSSDKKKILLQLLVQKNIFVTWVWGIFSQITIGKMLD